MSLRGPAAADDAPKHGDQGQVGEGVGELRAVAGLEVRQQVELAAVVGAMAAPAEPHDARRVVAPPRSDRGTRCAGSTGRRPQTRQDWPATLARCASEAGVTERRRSGVTRRSAVRRPRLLFGRSGFRRRSRPLGCSAVAVTRELVDQ